MVRTPQVIQGNLAHRCVLAAAGTWLFMSKARRLEDRYADIGPEPALVSQARRMARWLTAALAEGDEKLARALIDRNGPRWSGLYDDLLTLSPEDQKKAYDGIETAACAAARALLDASSGDCWVQIQPATIRAAP